MVLTSGNAAVSSFRRHVVIRKGSNVAGAVPWCREINTSVIARRQRPQHYSPLAVSGRRFFRSVESSSESGLTSSTAHQVQPLSQIPINDKNNNHNHNNKSSKNDSAWKITAVFAAIVSGACVDQFGTDTNDGTDDNNGVLRELGWRQTRISQMTPQRRDTSSFQIRLGGSVVVDHVVEPLSSTTVAGTHDNNDNVLLMLPEDKDTISPFLYYLMTQMQLVRITENDQCLYNLPIGLPGIACAHCSSWTKKKTWCQIFPMDRRTLPAQVRKSMYNHLRRCERCPPEIKMELKRLKKMEQAYYKGTTKVSREERQFFKKLWYRMGHKIEI